MAVCEIKSTHRRKGKTVGQTLFEAIDYATNAKKTTYIDENNIQKILATPYESGKNAADEWFLQKALYAKLTGRNH